MTQCAAIYVEDNLPFIQYSQQAELPCMEVRNT